MKLNSIEVNLLKSYMVIATLFIGISGANAQSLKANIKDKPWLGCCTHCSGVQCSGCSETTPLQAGNCNFIANCTTVNDETKCKPSSTARKKLHKLKTK